MPIARYIVSLGFAVAITLGIFYIMQSLIAQGQRDTKPPNPGKIIDFVRLRKESALETRKRKLPDKNEPDEPPPPPDFQLSNALAPDANALSIAPPSAGFDVNLSGGPNLGAFDGDSEAVPLVRVQPIYPERAAARGIEGWVTIEFTITPIGSVSDERVIASQPSSIFNRSALKAVKKFKYKPKVVDGTPVPQPGQKITLTFELED